MRYQVAIVSWLAAGSLAAGAFGHGNPIQIDVADGRLTVVDGLALSAGFARFASDPDEDAVLNVAPNGRLRSEFPGFDVAGLSEDAALQFELIGRPDFSPPDQPMRWLWFWDPSTQNVTTTVNDPLFYVSPLFGSGSIEVRQSAVAAGPTLTMADPIGPFLGADQHLLIYEVQNSPMAAAVGVYGVFARLKSPGLESSEPFLLAFRNGIATEDFAVAAEAINKAAGLPGDYNGNGMVDAADYAVWRDTLGSTTMLLADGSGNHLIDQDDYNLWRTNFGHTGAGAGSGDFAGEAVPEPSTLVLLAWMLLGAATLSRMRRGRTRLARR